MSYNKDSGDWKDQNHTDFLEWINDKFRDYKLETRPEEAEEICRTITKKKRYLDKFTKYQEFIKNYIIDSPYRGILLYHGYFLKITFLLISFDTYFMGI